MSRRKSLWKRKLTQVQGDASRFEATLPRAHVVGRGSYLAQADTAFAKAPHNERGAGAVCSLPMRDDKVARVLAIRKAS